MEILREAEYVAPHGLWLTCGLASIRIKPTDEGVSISVYKLGQEDQDSVVETWAHNSELEVE